MSYININILKKYHIHLYLFTIFLLLLVLLKGKEINGSKAWIHLYKISIQPSEIIKFNLILTLSILTIKQTKLYLNFIILLIPSILIFLEPDTGAILLLLIIYLSTLKYYKLNIKKIIIPSLLILLFILTNIIMYFNNKELLIKLYGSNLLYRIDRILMFKNQNNIQYINSLISIGSHNLLYIPENHNDFIFASIISKYGPLSFFTILLSYLLIFIILIKRTKNNNISNIISFMILNMLLFQIFYNILMNLSLLPIIGIPLPFLSYGGSYSIILYAIIGLSLNSNKMDKDHN